jgi:dGTPase
LLTEKQLQRNVRIWADASRRLKKEYGDLPDETRRYYIIRCIIDDQVKDVVLTTEKRIREAGVKSADDVRLQAHPLVQYSARRRKINLEVRKYLYQNLYYNPEVHEPNRRAVRMLEELFRHYLEHPEEVGEGARKRARKDGWPRAVCDYLAGMTDRYAIQEYQRLFGLMV